MKTKCYSSNPRYRRYEHVEVCESWKNSFIAFYNDMGPRPSPLHELVRIDRNGNHEPDNCRWQHVDERIEKNRRENRLLREKELVGAR